MSNNDFVEIDDIEIIKSDYARIKIGIIKETKNSFVCAIRTSGHIVKICEENVDYYVVITSRGMTKKSADLLQATTHAVLSTIIPGAGLAGALVSNSAAAAAGITTRGIATKAAGGNRKVYDVYICFKNKNNITIRCPDIYFENIKKHCLGKEITEKSFRGKIQTGRTLENEELERSCAFIACNKCGQRVSTNDNFSLVAGCRLSKRIIKVRREK